MAGQGDAIGRLGKVTLGITGYMLKGVEPTVFARQPADGKGGRIACNHPAFALGHLSLYPARLLPALDCELGPAAVPEGYEALFAAGVTCRDDPDGRIYPDMDQIVNHYYTAYQTLIDALSAVPEAQLNAQNPHEMMRDQLGLATIADACTFVLTSHAQFHLGQISTWRRAMGLGSAM